jgi:probable F420-dependent oxidoreductase
MKVGVAETFGSSPNRDVNYIKDFAAAAESLGFDSLWVPEHIVFFDDYDSRYPYNETGTLALGRNPGVFDPFPALTVAALATTTLEVGTSVMLIGERNPLLTAREVATVDQLSGGRFLFGVGVGWSSEEYDALGVPWERRGARCDEYIDVMKALWTTDRTTFSGEFCRFENVAAFPKPARSPHPPVLVGGNTKPALRRAARNGDGWFGWNLDLDELEKALAELDALLAAEGRSRDGFVVQVGRPHGGAPADMAAYAKRCEELALDRLIISAPISWKTFAAQLKEYSTAVIR